MNDEEDMEYEDDGENMAAKGNAAFEEYEDDGENMAAKGNATFEDVEEDGENMAANEDGENMAANEDGENMAANEDGENMAANEDGENMAANEDGENMAAKAEAAISTLLAYLSSHAKEAEDGETLRELKKANGRGEWKLVARTPSESCSNCVFEQAGRHYNKLLGRHYTVKQSDLAYKSEHYFKYFKFFSSVRTPKLIHDMLLLRRSFAKDIGHGVWCVTTRSSYKTFYAYAEEDAAHVRTSLSQFKPEDLSAALDEASFRTQRERRATVSSYPFTCVWSRSETKKSIKSKVELDSHDLTATTRPSIPTLRVCKVHEPENVPVLLATAALEREILLCSAFSSSRARELGLNCRGLSFGPLPAELHDKLHLSKLESYLRSEKAISTVTFSEIDVVANGHNEKNGEKVKGHDTDVVLRRLQIAREVYAREHANGHDDEGMHVHERVLIMAAAAILWDEAMSHLKMLKGIKSFLLEEPSSDVAKKKAKAQKESDRARERHAHVFHTRDHAAEKAKEAVEAKLENVRRASAIKDDMMCSQLRIAEKAKEAVEAELENVRRASAIKDDMMCSQLRIAEKAKEAVEVELENVRRASAIKDAELLATSTAAAAAEAGESALRSERVAARATEARLRSERDAARATAARLAQNESRLRSERNVARVAAAAAAAAENVATKAETIDDILKHLDTSVHEEARQAWDAAAANPTRKVIVSFVPPSIEMLEEWRANKLLTADPNKFQQLPAAYAKGYIDGRDEPICGQDATAVSVDIRGALKLLAEMDKLTSTEIVQRAKEVITHSERSVKATLKTDSRERAAAYIWLITIIMNNSICFVVILHAAVMRCINAMHPISTQLGIGTPGHLVIGRHLDVSMQNKKLLPSEESWDMEWKSSSLLTRCRCRLEELKVDRTGRQLRSAVAGVVEEGRRLSSNDGVDSLRKELLKMSFNENAGWMLRRAIDEKNDDDVLLALRDFIDAYGGDGSSRRLADLASFVYEEEEEEHPAEAMQTDRRAWDFDVDSDRRFIEPLVLALSAPQESENGDYDEQLEQLKAMSQKAKLQLAASKVLGKRNSPAA